MLRELVPAIGILLMLLLLLAALTLDAAHSQDIARAQHPTGRLSARTCAYGRRRMNSKNSCRNRSCSGVISTISSLEGVLRVTAVRSTSLRSWRITGISNRAARRLAISSTGRMLAVMATNTITAMP